MDKQTLKHPKFQSNRSLSVLQKQKNYVFDVLQQKTTFKIQIDWLSDRQIHIHNI